VSLLNAALYLLKNAIRWLVTENQMLNVALIMELEAGCNFKEKSDYLSDLEKCVCNVRRQEGSGQNHVNNDVQARGATAAIE